LGLTQEEFPENMRFPPVVVVHRIKPYMPQTSACTNSNNNPTSDDDILYRARRTVCQNVRPSVYITFFCLGTAADDVLFKNKYCVFPLGPFVPLVPRTTICTRHRPRLVFPLRHRRFGHCRVSFECEYHNIIQAHTHTRPLYSIRPSTRNIVNNI